MKKLHWILLILGLVAYTSASLAQEWEVDEKQLSELYSGKAYSPFAGRTFRSAHFGVTPICIHPCHSMRVGSAIDSPRAPLTALPGERKSCPPRVSR